MCVEKQISVSAMMTVFVCVSARVEGRGNEGKTVPYAMMERLVAPGV